MSQQSHHEDFQLDNPDYHQDLQDEEYLLENTEPETDDGSPAVSS